MLNKAVTPKGKGRPTLQAYTNVYVKPTHPLPIGPIPRSKKLPLVGWMVWLTYLPPPAIQPSSAHAVLQPQLVVELGVTAMVAWYSSNPRLPGLADRHSARGRVQPQLRERVSPHTTHYASMCRTAATSESSRVYRTDASGWFRECGLGLGRPGSRGREALQQKHHAPPPYASSSVLRAFVLLLPVHTADTPPWFQRVGSEWCESPIPGIAP